VIILNALFSGECVICSGLFHHRGQNVVCPDCISRIKKENTLFCRSCGVRKENCQRCSGRRFFDDFSIFTKRSREITEAIYWLKIKKYRPIASEIGRTISEDIGMFIKSRKIDVVIFIPLDKKTFRERGFNHLEEILRSAVPDYLIKSVIEKVKKTKLQMELPAEERQRNLKGAFSLMESIKDKNVLIFDDIITTGSTMMEAFKTVKKGKPSKIYGYVIAG